MHGIRIYVGSREHKYLGYTALKAELKIATKHREMSSNVIKSLTTPIIELLSGVYRYLPNTITVSLIVLGVFLGKIAWILCAAGAIVLSFIVSLFQYAKSLTKLGGLDTMGVIDSTVTPVSGCTLYVSKTTDVFNTIPSMWMAIACYYMTFITINGSNVIYREKKRTGSSFNLFQRRQGIGIISMITTIILFLCIIIPRFILSHCESILGSIVGGVLGIGFGLFWWNLLNSCGPDVYPDIHGVMLGLYNKKYDYTFT